MRTASTRAMRPAESEIYPTHIAGAKTTYVRGEMLTPHACPHIILPRSRSPDHSGPNERARTLMVADPRKTELAGRADSTCRWQPGTGRGPVQRDAAPHPSRRARIQGVCRRANARVARCGASSDAPDVAPDHRGSADRIRCSEFTPGAEHQHAVGDGAHPAPTGRSRHVL